MDIRELLRALNCFNKDLHVTIKDENWPHCETKEIAIVNYDGNSCVIETGVPIDEKEVEL